MEVAGLYFLRLCLDFFHARQEIFYVGSNMKKDTLISSMIQK